MAKPLGTITWKGRNTNNCYKGDVTRAVFLLSEDGTAVARITMACDYLSYAYGVSLDHYGGNAFRGQYQKFEQESKRLVRQGPVSCKVLNAIQGQPMLLGDSAWVDEGEWECDWMGQLETVERVPFNTWMS
jgi:hypothetical protein